MLGGVSTIGGRSTSTGVFGHWAVGTAALDTATLGYGRRVQGEQGEPKRRLRVVVVDNDPGALELAVTDLDLEGHEIVGRGADGEEALRLVASEHPDVLVVDHRMPPGPWGLEVAERVRREYPETRVIVYSNYQSVELIRRVREAGAIYLPKGNLRSLRRAVVGDD